MLDYIKGKIVSLQTTDVVLEQGGIGYQLHITLNTFDGLKGKETAQLYTHLQVKNEGQNVSGFALYGFTSPTEREYFQTIIGVSGIGASTARLMLSSMQPKEIAIAVAIEDVNRITSVKGIGPKTAKRLILELKDKIGKLSTDDNSGKQMAVSGNTIAEEALSALLMLGFNRTAASKAVQSIMNDGATTVEEVVKLSLKKL